MQFEKNVAIYKAITYKKKNLQQTKFKTQFSLQQLFSKYNYTGN